MITKVVAVVGSYRKDGTIDSAVEAVLAGAREKGAETVAFHLREKHVEFCTNCRQCVQAPGAERVKCVQQDDMEPMLQAIDEADAVVLASPINFYNVTAIFRRFMERTLGYGYWPWSKPTPGWRNRNPRKKAVLVASSAAPRIFIPLATGAAKALKVTARTLGAKPVGRLWIGLVGGEPHYQLSDRERARAMRMGRKLVKSIAA